MSNLLFAAALISLAVDESPLMRELEQSFGEVAWISAEDKLALEIKGGLVFSSGSGDLSRDSASTLRQLGRVLTKQSQVSVLLLGGTALSAAVHGAPSMGLQGPIESFQPHLPGTALSSGEAGKDEKLARSRAATARNYLIMQMRSYCDSTGRSIGCENLDKRIKARAEDPPVRAATGLAERAAADRVRILLQF